jgi:hypothetical protein
MKCGCKRRMRDMRRALVSKLAPVFGANDVRTRKPRDGPAAPDITAPHFAIACMRGARTDARAVLRDAWNRTRYPDEWAVAVCQDDGQRPYVAMTLADFVDLLTDWHAYRQRAIA